MKYNLATLYAATGNIIKFKNWIGYFYWNYEEKEMNFRNGDYHLNSNEFNDIKNKDDWYYI